MEASDSLWYMNLGRRNHQLKVNRSKLQAATEWKDSLLSGFNMAGVRAGKQAPVKSISWLIIAVVMIIFLLGFQLVKLQLVEGARLAQLAEGNRLRQKITYSPRGRILDRHGVELAVNRASFQLVANPYLLPKDAAARERTYRQIAKILNIPAQGIKKAAEAKGLSDTQPQLIKDNIDYTPALKLEQKLPQLAGFTVDGVPIRRYLSGAALAHTLGYVGRASEADIKANANLSLVDFLGKDGVEAQYDNILRGQNGVVQTEVDAGGRPLRVINEQPTQAGRDVTLSLDYKLQQKFAQAIAKQMQAAGVKRAAGVAIDPNTGEILASVSLPAYNNNLFSGGISASDYNRLINDSLQPLHNKVLGGGYPPGSVIKPMHLSAALQEGVVNENTVIYDGGRIVVPSVYDPKVEYVFRGWNPAGLGAMDARRAIAMSSDIYFYTTGGGFEGFRGLGVDKLTEYYKKFGLGSLTGVDLPGETEGRIPNPEWKKQNKGEDWFVGDTYNISIGQGDILANPLQMAVATAAITNGGKILKPHIFKGSESGQTATPTVLNQNFIDPKHLLVAKEGMKAVIGGTTATSTFAQVGVPVAGKSGTAETDPTSNRKPHAWYTAFAPYDKPKILFALILEEGEGGSQFAAPAIAEAMEWYFKTRR